jgi:O-antigen ligase
MSIARLLANLRPDDDAPPDPVAVVLALGLVGVAGAGLVLGGVPLRLAQPLTAAAFLLVSVGLIVRSTANGIVLLFLLPPFFNGDNDLPYFWLLDTVLLFTLLRGFAGHLWWRRPLAFPRAPVFVLFLLSAVISLPLDLRALWLEVQVSPWSDVLETLRRGGLPGRLAYVRAVLNVASGIALCVLVVNRPWPPAVLRRLATAITLLLAISVTLGFGAYWAPTATRPTFVTVWLGGTLNRGFPGLGFNVSYFAQFVLAYLPLVGLVLAERSARWAMALGLAVLPLVCSAVLLTRQRGAYLVLVLELVLLLVVGLRARWSGAAPRRGGLVPGAIATVVTVAALLAFTQIGETVRGSILEKWQQGDEVRTHLLAVTARMFADQPLLGIGSGRFFDLFPLYSSRPEMQFGSWSAHNLYAQLLAEQGAVGLLSLLALIGITLGPAARAVRRGTASPALAFFLVSLATWLVYGVLQYTFLLRAMQLYFWIALGVVVALSPAPARPPRLGRRWRAVGLAVLVVIAGVRLHAVMLRPAPGAWGFHDWQPGEMRWTRGGAWLALPVGGPILRLTFAGPDPRITGRPQQVLVTLDGVRVGWISLAPGIWTTLDVPVGKPVGTTVLLQLRPAYTFIPAALGINDDSRRLGVLVKPLLWLPGGPRAPAASGG